MSRLARFVDRVLEWAVVPSFTRIGHAVRRRLFGWDDTQRLDRTGRVVVITGATSGLGRAAAERIARAGATLVVVGRDRERTERACEEIADASGNPDVEPVVADLGDFEQVREAAAEIARRHERLDVLIHNAGALLGERTENDDGVEVTVAVHVVGPFLLTTLLDDLLEATPGARVLTMSSGGMYTADLRAADIEMPTGDYNGSKQYARAKRAQVTLNEMWAERSGPDGPRFHALHPGWADTPGIADALPGFHRVVGRLLRSPEEGADTLVWLALDDGVPLTSTGRFWLDRRPRPIHRLRRTRRSDTAERRGALWRWVSDAAGVSSSS